MSAADQPFSFFMKECALPNTGSTARDHLANERTFEAWMRLVLSMIGATLYLLESDTGSNIWGWVLGFSSLITLLVITQRYYRQMIDIKEGQLIASSRGALIYTVIVVIIIVAFLLSQI